MSGALAISKFEDVALSLTPEFHLLKANALEAAKPITAPTDTASLEVAVAAGSALKRLKTDLEKSRNTVKAPVLELGRKIDALAKKESAEIEKELTRIEGLVSAYQRVKIEEARKAQEMADTLARKRQERLDAEAAEQEKERLRLEEAAKKTEDPDEAAHLAEQAQQAQEAAERAREKAVAPSPLGIGSAPRVEKLSASRPWKFVVDDIAAVYASRPDLCSLEIKTAATNAAIAAGAREIPGLRIWQEDTTRIRA